MTQWKPVLVATLGALILGMGGTAHAAAPKTRYPVVFAHGLSGYDNLLGLYYFGDGLGNFVGDPCDEFLEVICNPNLARNQRAFAAQVPAFQSSEVRGLDLANDLESFMATADATRVNIIGHSQGGMDARKAARVLYERKGRTVVDVLISVSSPHRGSPVAKFVLDLGQTPTGVANLLVQIFGNIVFEPGNDLIASLQTLVYDDYDANDGIITGARAFNTAYPIDSRYASHYASVLTAQNSLALTPLFLPITGLVFNIDGDGYCVDDCDNDGAAGQGNGNPYDRDDDGVVGINSQQMGPRLRWTQVPFGLDSFAVDATVPPVTNINAPNAQQMTSLSSVIDHDHLDVTGTGALSVLDPLDRNDFYAALIQYVFTKE